MSQAAPQPPNPEIPRGEQQVDPPTLAEAKAQEIGQRLDQIFADPNCKNDFGLAEAAELLESEETAVIYAIEGGAVHLENLQSLMSTTRFKASARALTQDEILAINRSPLVRTLNNSQIQERLGLPSQKAVAEIAKTHGIEPRRKFRNQTYYGAFDLDQIATIESHALASGEAQTQISLVEQQRQKVASQLEAYFGKPRTPQSFSFARAAKLLDSEPHPVSRAIQDLGYFDLPDKPDRAQSMLGSRHGRFQLTREQILELNDHPYVHSKSIAKITKDLGCSQGMITEISIADDIEPIIASSSQNATKENMTGSYFDLDQIELLRKGLERFNPPKDAIAVNGLRERFPSLTPDRVANAALNAGVEINWYRDPVARAEAEFVTRQGLRRILQFLANKSQ